jgi:hypothetical protein
VTTITVGNELITVLLRRYWLHYGGLVDSLGNFVPGLIRIFMTGDTREQTREMKGVYMKRNSVGLRSAIGLIVLAGLGLTQASAQVLTADQVKKAAPNSFFFSGQSGAVQARNTGGFKNSAGKLTLAGLVDTAGYATAIAEKYQGFLITETKLGFEGGSLDPGAYGFGFKDGKFVVMNVAGADVISIASQSDEKVKHPVPLKVEKNGDGYRLHAGRKYVVVKPD